MGGKDSPTPRVMDVSHEKRGLTPPHSPMKRKDSISSSVSASTVASIASTVDSVASTTLSSPVPFKRSPSIRYVPRSKSSVNLEMRKRNGSVEPPPVSELPSPVIGRSSTLTRCESSASSVQAYMECLAPLSLKCVLVGDSGVGKTSLLMSYTTEKFVTTHTPTIYDKFSTSLTVYGRRINMTLCDTSGCDDFGHLRPLCYPQADVALVCFSVIDHTSFVNARGRWIKELRKHCPNVPVILVGTHVDKRDSGTLLRDFRSSNKGYISKSEGLKAASQMKAVTYIECSSRTKVNVKTAFDEAISTAMEMNRSKSHQKDCTIL